LHTRAWIGNDIVDLAEPGVAGKERDQRFMNRVFTPAERERILEAAAPTIALWKAWTAKEAAFKVASKLRSRLVFRHQAFEVLPDEAAGVNTRLRAAVRATADQAHVRFEDLLIRVKWDAAKDYIHCIGQLAGAEWDLLTGVANDEDDTLDPRLLTDAERASVYSMASARARLLARELMTRWDLHRVEVLRLWRARGWSAPVLAEEGRRLAGFDVSLSHDGRYVAAALSGPA
jgi:phosphopantetheine--protein transferase-like protein